MKDSRSALLAEVLDRHRALADRTGQPNILETLLAVQAALGAVPVGSVPEIARALEVTEADVAGVLTYYPELRTAPPGRHLIRVCMGESCMANHGDRVLNALRDKLHVDPGQTTGDGRFTLERIYCVGNCAVGPSVMVDHDVHGRVTETTAAEVLDEYQ
jgi:NADH:ubiquinone oxidoreductase subunit E